MRIIRTRSLIALVFLTLPLYAQAPPPPEAHITAGVHGKNVFVYHSEMGGKWWQNSETVKKLQLNDSQISQLDQIFFDHRMKLIDYGAEMEKQDLKLQSLLDADVPNEGQIGGQVDQVLEARGKLEREYTNMNLDLRKVLSLAQWRQLKSIRGSAGGGFGGKVFFHKGVPPPGEPDTMLPPPGASMLPPLPPPGNDSVDEEVRQ
jgi:Spy/CpxP family protein refolding chaperone